MRQNCMEAFSGGAFMQNTSLVAPLNGGAYAPGDNFDLSIPDITAAQIFDPKYYQTTIALLKEDIQVRNAGPAKVFSIIDLRLRAAMNTISAIIAVAMARHGQPSSSTIVGNRPKHLNGWIEAINDGVSQGWEGSIFANYGTQARNGFVGSTLNSVPYYCGDSSGNAGPITYQILEETYQDCSIGNVEPDLGVCNKALYAYIKERIQPQQRFQQEKDPVWGVTGFRINNAMVLKDDYFPSLRYGKNDPKLGNYLTSTFTAASTNLWGGTNMTSGTANVGEVFAWFNTKKWLFRISDNPEYAFGFSGFVPAQDNTRVAGQVKAMVNMQCLAPRLNKQIFGINS